MVPIQPQKRPRSPNQRRITSYPSRSRAGIQESFQNRGSRRAARRGRVGEKNARWQLRLAQITNQTQRRTSRTRFKVDPSEQQLSFYPPTTQIRNPKHRGSQTPAHFRVAHPPRRPRSQRRKAAGGEGSGSGSPVDGGRHGHHHPAHPPPPPARRQRRRHVRHGRRRPQRHGDLSPSLSAQRSHNTEGAGAGTGTRRRGRDVGRSWLAPSLSALAREQRGFPRTARSAIKKGSRRLERLLPVVTVFYFSFFCRCRF